MKEKIQPFGDDLVTLRLLSEADLEVTLRWRNEHSSRIWFKNSQKIEFSDHKKWFMEYKLKADDYVFIVEYVEKIIGQVSVYNIDSVERTAEVGRFIVDPDYRGKGLIKRSCALLLMFCFDSLNLEKLYLDVKSENTRAIELYRKLGFSSENMKDGYTRMMVWRT